MILVWVVVVRINVQRHLATINIQESICAVKYPVFIWRSQVKEFSLVVVKNVYHGIHVLRKGFGVALGRELDLNITIIIDYLVSIILVNSYIGNTLWVWMRVGRKTSSFYYELHTFVVSFTFHLFASNLLRTHFLFGTCSVLGVFWFLKIKNLRECKSGHSWRNDNFVIKLNKTSPKIPPVTLIKVWVYKDTKHCKMI